MKPSHSESWPDAEEVFDRLRLRNVRCFRSVEVPIDPQVTVLLGGNGSGKTTIVEALASLTAGPGEGLVQFPLRRRCKNGEIALFRSGSAKPAAVWRVTGGDSDRRNLPEERYLLAYGRYRRVFFPQDESEESRTLPSVDLDEMASRAASRRTVTLFEPDNNLLRDLSRYLIALDFGRKSDPRLDRIWHRLNESLDKLGQGISGIRMAEGTYGYIPEVVRNGRPEPLRQLSDGFQAFLVILFDLLLRYAYLFPTLENPLEGAAIVAIDEIDLHLHPRWQRHVVSQLTDLFPRTQFILTTHSPFVVQGAIDQKRQIVLLEEQGGFVEVRPLGKIAQGRLQGAEVEAVLMHGRLFDLESRYSPEYSQIEQRADELQAKVSKGAASEEEQQELFRHLDKLQTLLVKDEQRRGEGRYLARMAQLRLALLKDLREELKKAKAR